MHQLVIHYQQALNRTIQVRLEGRASEILTFEIEALLLKSEKFIHNLALNGRPIQPEDGRIDIPPGNFFLTYEITSPYSVLVGANVDLAVHYPFFNGHEIHFGSGVLPVIRDYEKSSAPLHYQVRFEGIPDGWSIISNLPVNSAGAIVPTQQIAQVFVHLSSDLQIFHSKCGRFRVALGHGVQPPLAPQEIFEFCQSSIEFQEKCFGRNPKIRDLSILYLQAPRGFKALTQGQTMAAGQNYTGGIAIFGSDEVENYGPLGHSDYLDFVLYGLHHEIGHAFTSAGPARFKSLLYASGDCPKADRFRIGEVLNIYFNPATRLLFQESYPFRLRTWVETLYQKALQKKPSMLMDWFLFDCALRSESGIGLVDVFRQMLEQKRLEDSPYDSIESVFDAAERITNRRPHDFLRRKLTQPDPETYAEQLDYALASIQESRDTLANDREGTLQFFLGERSVDDRKS
ncbi:MAG: hypothetical protein KGQ59_00675 [Bdellovibrionales bacterium]|nr:hypothetical protein [Bdellovibrionales bacterium]